MATLASRVEKLEGRKGTKAHPAYKEWVSRWPE